jgi:hypothetical protein
MRASAAALLSGSSKLGTEQVEVAEVMLVTFVAEVAASNLCRDTDYRRSRFSCLSLSPSRQCLARAYKIEHGCFHPEPFQFSIHQSTYNFYTF